MVYIYKCNYKRYIFINEFLKWDISKKNQKNNQIHFFVDFCL